jgi:uncharacterized membrane protein HdeD (DUF308 family)
MNPVSNPTHVFYKLHHYSISDSMNDVVALIANKEHWIFVFFSGLVALILALYALCLA